MDLFQAPLLVLIKSATIMNDDAFIDIIPIAWELLLDIPKETVAAAAAMFILSAVRCPEPVTALLNGNLRHPDPAERFKALLKYVRCGSIAQPDSSLFAVVVGIKCCGGRATRSGRGWRRERRTRSKCRRTRSSSRFRRRESEWNPCPWSTRRGCRTCAPECRTSRSIKTLT